MINLSSFIAFHARRTPTRCALKYRGEDISYAAFDDRIRKVAGWLVARGIGPDAVVAVLMRNSTAFLELAFATSHIGAVFLPINYRLSADEVGYIVGNSGARLLVADEEFAAIAAGGGPIVLLDEAAQASATHLAPDGEPAPMHPRQPGDLMRLMYTSGTTDRPKGVMLTYENMYWKSADQTLVLGLNAETRLLVVGPLYHVGALDLPGIAVLWHGGLLSVHRNFEPEQTLAAIESERLNAAWFAPVMTTALLTHPARNRYDVSSLKWVIGGGEKTRRRAFALLRMCSSKRAISTHTASLKASAAIRSWRRGARSKRSGRRDAPSLTSRSISETITATAFLPVGTTRYAYVVRRSPKGYLEGTSQARAAFFGDWFRTGDVGHLDAEGFLYLTDRRRT